MRISGSRVVVTGASSGIGRQTALTLARKGARVLAVARSEAALKELAAAHEGIDALVTDLSDRTQRARLFDDVEPVDVLVNNAGVGSMGLVEATAEEEVRHLYEVNVLAGIDLAMRVLPGMLARRRGSIVQVSSASAWSAFPPLSVYASTKAAMQGFTQGLHRELLGRGVTVATVNPGPTATRFGPAARSAHRPAGELPDATMPGMPVAWVTRAIVKAIRYGGLPGYRTIAVPRLMGFARLDTIPVTQWAVDAVALVARPGIRRRAARERGAGATSAERIDPVVDGRVERGGHR